MYQHEGAGQSGVSHGTLHQSGGKSKSPPAGVKSREAAALSPDTEHGEVRIQATLFLTNAHGCITESVIRLKITASGPGADSSRRPIHQDADNEGRNVRVRIHIHLTQVFLIANNSFCKIFFIYVKKNSAAPLMVMNSSVAFWESWDLNWQPVGHSDRIFTAVEISHADQGLS